MYKEITTETKIETFRDELNLIPDVYIRRWVENCLALTPDYFYEVSASDSNKNHPYWDLGSGGTIRHTKAVTKVAYDMAGTVINKAEEQRDIKYSKLIAACILHDSFKYGITFDLRIYPLHPYIPRAVLKDVITNVPIDPNIADWIFKAIESHMGPLYDGSWAPLHYITKANLSSDPLAYLVHQADYLASRKDFVDKRFEEYNKGIEPESLPHYEPFPDNILKGIIYGVLLEEMPEEKVMEKMKDEKFIGFFERIKSLRNPYKKRKYEYNLDNIIKYIRNNLNLLGD